MSAMGRKRTLRPALRTAASLVDLSFDLALNLSKEGFGFLATIHTPGDQDIPVSPENDREYWQTKSWRIVNGSGYAGHKFSHNCIARGELWPDTVRSAMDRKRTLEPAAMTSLDLMPLPLLVRPRAGFAACRRREFRLRLLPGE